MFLFNLTDKLGFFGVVYSLILIAGLYQIGSLIFKIDTIKKIFVEISDIKYKKVFLITNIVLLICYPLNRKCFDFKEICVNTAKEKYSFNEKYGYLMFLNNISN